MKYGKLGFLVIFFLLAACRQEQVYTNLLRSTPEAEGVSAKGILTFLDSAAVSKHEFHSFMFLRHGKVVAEGWWSPYRSDLKHSLYSTSKSFTSTAVGFAVTEKKLSLDDKVLSFFPEDKPDTVSPFLAELKVRDLITMSVGMDPDPTGRVVTQDSNWVKGFLATPIVNKPGTKFLYNTLSTYMLSAIVQKVTGQKVIDYLTPRLFEPLGIKGEDWETDLQGINTGGWGLRLKTEDMAKFGQLLLQKGRWQGKQLIPASWVDEATSFKIDQAPNAPPSKKDSSDWMQGYCYQFWRCRHNAFRADGAFGQYIIVMPDKDAVIAITAESPDMQDEINLVWKYLYTAIADGKLPADEASDKLLAGRLSSLALPLPAKGMGSTLPVALNGKTFDFPANTQQVKSMQLHFGDSLCKLDLATETGNYEFSYGLCKWAYGESTKPGPYLVNGAKNMYVGLPPLRVAGCYTFTDPNTLELVLRYYESPHTLYYLITLDTGNLRVETRISFNPDLKIPPLEGKLKK